MPKYPYVDRSNRRPNFVKKDRDDQLDLGFAEGIFTDGRPFRVESWAATYVTYLTFYFSSVDIEHFSQTDLKEYLNVEQVIKFDDQKFLSSGFSGVNISSKKTLDASKNEIWEVTIIVGDEDGSYIHNSITMQGYNKKESLLSTTYSETSKQLDSTESRRMEKESQSEKKNVIYNFVSDGTIKWLSRKGDYVFWFTWDNLPIDEMHGIRIKNIWEMKDGDYLTITNRVEDMPKWFSFHPTEVCNSLAYNLLDKFNRGEYPEKPIERSNIWRPKTGDRLVWLRNYSSVGYANNYILSAIAFHENALVIGENIYTQSDAESVNFGSLTKHQQTEEDIAIIRNAVGFVKQMGVPREYESEWRIG